MTQGRFQGATWRFVTLGAVVLIALAIIFIEVGPSIIGTEEPTSTPVPTTTTLGDLPLPMNCQIAPRSLQALVSVSGTPNANMATPSANPSSVPSIVGTPADPEVVAQIKATYREAISCLNAGQFARVMSLYSDQYARILVVNAASTTNVSAEAMAAVLATPAPLPTMQWTAIHAMGDIQQLDDGRVSAIIVTQKAQMTSPPEIRIVIFVHERGRWVIDEIIPITIAGTPTA